MDYGRIFQDAWALTWRHRFLWLFGLFAGGAGSSGMNFNIPSGGGSGSGSETFGGDEDLSEVMEQLQASAQMAIEEIQAWVAANLGVLVLLGILFLVISFFFVVLSLVCKGAMLGGLGRLAQGQSASFGSALAIGVRRFPPLFFLWLMFFALGLFLAVLVLGGVITSISSLPPEAAMVALLAGLGLLGVLLFVVSIPLTVILAYAERAIVMDGYSVFSSLGRGFALVRARIGPSALLWLISIAIGIGAGIAFAIGAFFLLIPIGIFVAIPFIILQVHAISILIAAIGVLLFIGCLWVAGAVLNTYVSAFWTLGYLGLTERYPTPVAA
jgi:hypothetical protein